MANKCPVHGHRKLMDDDYFANPYAAYERFATPHEQGTVHGTCLDDHGRVWLVTGRAKVCPALRDTAGAARRWPTSPSAATTRPTPGVSLPGTV